jgi:hypothetical protein
MAVEAHCEYCMKTVRIVPNALRFFEHRVECCTSVLNTIRRQIEELKVQEQKQLEKFSTLQIQIKSHKRKEIERLQKELQSENEQDLPTDHFPDEGSDVKVKPEDLENQCGCCMENKKVIAASGCGHRLCNTCSREVRKTSNKCPECRKPWKNLIRIY